MGGVDITTATPVLVEKLYYNSTGLCKSYAVYGTDETENTRSGYNIGRSHYIPFGWCGMYRDPFTGKYHTHFRDYDPVHGRWLSEDPAGYADGLNLYNAYMGVNGVDLLGLDYLTSQNVGGSTHLYYTPEGAFGLNGQGFYVGFMTNDPVDQGLVFTKDGRCVSYQELNEKANEWFSGIKGFDDLSSLLHAPLPYDMRLNLMLASPPNTGPQLVENDGSYTPIGTGALYWGMVCDKCIDLQQPIRHPILAAKGFGENAWNGSKHYGALLIDQGWTGFSNEVGPKMLDSIPQYNNIGNIWDSPRSYEQARGWFELTEFTVQMGTTVYGVGSFGPKTSNLIIPKTWNEFQHLTRGQFASRAEAAQAWNIFKENNGIITGTARSSAVKRSFLKDLAESGNSPQWMNQWLKKGKVPPGYHVDHYIALFDGGEDVPRNMRLKLISDHITRHRYYRPRP